MRDDLPAHLRADNALGRKWDNSKVAAELADSLARTLRCALQQLDAMPEEERSLAKEKIRERARRSAQVLVNELENFYRYDGNPIHALRAIGTADLFGLPTPSWAMDYIVRSAARVVEMMVFEAYEGLPLDRQAERVGKAFGFGTGGSGRSGTFQKAAWLYGDWEIYLRVTSLCKAGEKKYRAWEIVADERGVDRSTIRRACERYLRARRRKGKKARLTSRMRPKPRAN